MAGEQATKASAGTATVSSLGSTQGAQDAVDRLMAQVKLVGDALQLTQQKVVALGAAYRTALDRAVQGGRECLTTLNSIQGNLSSQMTAVEKLTGLYQGLGNAMQSAKLPAGAVGAPDHGKTVIGASNTVMRAAGKTVLDSASYKDVVNDIAIKGEGNTDPDKRQEARNNISDTATAISNDTGMGKADAAELIREMLNSGLDLKQSLELAPLAAQFSKGQGVSAQDTAALFRSLQEGEVTNSKENPDAVKNVLNQIIAQAKDGKVGIGDVTQMMPRMMAAMDARKLKGPDSVILAAQLLQERGKSLGTTVQIAADVEYQIREKALPEVQKKASTDYVEDDLKSRREGSAQIHSEMGAAFSRLSINIGDALSPVTDNVMKAVTVVVNGLANLVQACGSFSTVLGTLVLAVTGAVSAFAALRTGKELLGAGKAVFGRGGGEAGEGKGAWLKRIGSRLLGTDEPSGSSASGQSGADAESKVFVTNWPGALTKEPAPPSEGKREIDVVVKNWPASLKPEAGKKGTATAKRESGPALDVMVKNWPASLKPEAGKKGAASAKRELGPALDVMVKNWPASLKPESGRKGTVSEHGKFGAALDVMVRNWPASPKEDKPPPKEAATKTQDVVVKNWPASLKPNAGKDGAAVNQGRRGVALDVMVRNWPGSFTRKTARDATAPQRQGGGGAKNVWVRNWPSALAQEDRKDTPAKAIPAAGGNKATRVFVTNWPGNAAPGRDDGTKQKKRKGRPDNNAGKPKRTGQTHEERSNRRTSENLKRSAPADSPHSARSSARTFAGGPPSQFSFGFAGNGGSSVSLGAAESVLSRAFGTFSKVASLARNIPGSRYLNAGMTALETFQNADTLDEKAEGYGAAAGDLGGSVVGGAVGAALGSVLIPIPGVGTAIGAMVGSTLGGMVGGDLGGKLGKYLFGSGHKPEDQATPTKAATPVVSLESSTARQYGPAVPAPVPASVASEAFTQQVGNVQVNPANPPAAQYFTVSPSIPITVQGTIADPADLVRQLTPEIQRLFADLAAQANRGNQMWDTPGTTYVA